jgi:hypothetical protein
MTNRFEGDKYMTIGFLSTVPVRVQFLIFEMIEKAKTDLTLLGLDVDYLQVFDLERIIENGKSYQRITHHQESPEYKFVATFPCEDAILERIFVISSYIGEGQEMSTVMLSSEY